jgi:hypothetical protein
MSLINTNHNYLETMGIAENDPLVGIIVSVYYLGCAIGGSSFLCRLEGEEGCYILLSGHSQSRIHHYVPLWCQALTGLWRSCLSAGWVMGLGVGRYLADMQP